MTDTTTPDPNAFRDWLQGQLAERGWSRSQLARELDVFKGTVGRWLLPPDDPKHRRPNYVSCRRIATIFGVDTATVLALAGLDVAADELTDLQRQVIALVRELPDDDLTPVLERLHELAKAHNP